MSGSLRAGGVGSWGGRTCLVLADLAHGHQGLQVLVGVEGVDVMRGAAVPGVTVGGCEVAGHLWRPHNDPRWSWLPPGLRWALHPRQTGRGNRGLGSCSATGHLKAAPAASCGAPGPWAGMAWCWVGSEGNLRRTDVQAGQQTRAQQSQALGSPGGSECPAGTPAGPCALAWSRPSGESEPRVSRRGPRGNPAQPHWCPWLRGRAASAWRCPRAAPGRLPPYSSLTHFPVTVSVEVKSHPHPPGRTAALLLGDRTPQEVLSTRGGAARPCRRASLSPSLCPRPRCQTNTLC